MSDTAPLLLQRALRSVAAEERRARRASAIAERHDMLADLAVGTQSELIHRRAAHIHRMAADRHRNAAAFYSSVVFSALRDHDTGDDSDRPGTFTASLAALTGSESTALTLSTGHSGDILLASDDRARAAHDLEFTLGEGPTRDCLTSGALYAQGDAITARWRIFGPALRPLQIRSVATVPLRPTALTHGTVVVYDLEPARVEDELARLRSVGEAFLSIALEELATRDGTAVLKVDQLDLHDVIHQAAGMIASRHLCSTTDAVALLRAHAFAEERTVDEIAQDVVAHGLLLD